MIGRFQEAKQRKNKIKRVKSSNVYKTTTVKKESRVKFAEEKGGIENNKIIIPGDFR